MFLKLLKNDLKSIFKYWWIGAVVSLFLSVIGGFILEFLSKYDGRNDTLEIFSVLGFMLVVGGISAFALLSEILIFARYYNNCFTDEGYLTFTLPVKRSQLLNSKFIASLIVNAATGLCLYTNVINIFVIAFRDDKDFWNSFVYMFEEIPDFASEWLYVAEALVLFVGLVVLSTLLMFVCITFASVVAKKGKVFAAIGIYYGVTMVISFFLQIVYTIGGVWLFEWIATLSEAFIKSFVALFLFVIILFVVTMCVVLYTLTLWMIDKKLNLS